MAKQPIPGGRVVGYIPEQTDAPKAAKAKGSGKAKGKEKQPEESAAEKASVEE